MNKHIKSIIELVVIIVVFQITNAVGVAQTPKIVRFEFHKDNAYIGRFVIEPNWSAKDANWPNDRHQVVLQVIRSKTGMLANFNVENIRTGNNTIRKELTFEVSKTNELKSFRLVLEKMVEWAATAKQNSVTDFKKEIGTFKLAGGEAQTASFVVSNTGAVRGLIDSSSSGSYIPIEAANVLLFAVNALDESIPVYLKKLAEREAEKGNSTKKKDDLFK